MTGHHYRLPSGATVWVLRVVENSHATCCYVNGYGGPAWGVGEVVLTPLFLARWGRRV
jgi:hypothetical protein